MIFDYNMSNFKIYINIKIMIHIGFVGFKSPQKQKEKAL